MDSILETKSLTVKIASTLVCNDLSLSINAGDKWGIIGVNGVGKTTLLHTFAGLYPSTSGEIFYGAKLVSEMGHRHRAQYRGVLFQDNTDPFPSTVLESVLAGRHPHIEPWQWESNIDIQIARDNLALVELQYRETQMVNTLSGGERQRVAIATLLTQQPKLFLLDEPTSHLDLKSQMMAMDIFCNQVDAHRSSIVMVLHDVNLASRFCNKVLMLYGDGKFSQGNTRDLLTVEALTELYGYPVNRLEHKNERIFVPG